MDKIDFVITWVDQNDQEWQAEKNKYLPPESRNTDFSEVRYRDMGTIKYLLRSIEMYAPWVNKVYFITAGHIPPWLNIKNNKLVHVKHSDFINPEYLPTFNSHPIELNLHRIKGLSRKFVYFNDDCLLSNPTTPTQFFINNIPCDFCINVPLQADGNDIFMQLLFNNMSIINKYFSIKNLLNINKLKYFNFKYKKHIVSNIIFAKHSGFKKFYGLLQNHHPQPFLKSTFETVWSKEKELLHQTSLHKFRSSSDVTPYLIRYWQLASGQFTPVTYTDRYYKSLEVSGESFKKALFSKKYKFICLNDSAVNCDFEKKQKEFLTILEEKFPQKSTFEL